MNKLSEVIAKAVEFQASVASFVKDNKSEANAELIGKLTEELIPSHLKDISEQSCQIGIRIGPFLLEFAEVDYEQAVRVVDNLDLGGLSNIEEVGIQPPTETAANDNSDQFSLRRNGKGWQVLKGDEVVQSYESERGAKIGLARRRKYN